MATHTITLNPVPTPYGPEGVTVAITIDPAHYRQFIKRDGAMVPACAVKLARALADDLDNYGVIITLPNGTTFEVEPYEKLPKKGEITTIYP
jgi:hypothetical protein